MTQLQNYAIVSNHKSVDYVYKRMYDKIRQYMKSSKLKRKLRGNRYRVTFDKTVHERECKAGYLVVCRCTITRIKRTN